MQKQCSTSEEQLSIASSLASTSSPLSVGAELKFASPVESDEDFRRYRFEQKLSSQEELPFDLSEPALVLKKRSCIKEEEILSFDLANKLRKHLPPLYRLSSSWHLVYSSAQHGFSLNTLYSRSRRAGPCLLAIKDDQGAIFGAFASETLKPHIGHFGSGETFLWTYKSLALCQAFLASGLNEYYLIAEPSFIAVGCGDGKFGLWLDEALLNGQTTSVPTFLNDVLASQPEFVCIGIELWAFEIESD